MVEFTEATLSYLNTDAMSKTRQSIIRPRNLSTNWETCITLVLDIWQNWSISKRITIWYEKSKALVANIKKPHCKRNKEINVVLYYAKVPIILISNYVGENFSLIEYINSSYTLPRTILIKDDLKKKWYS